MSLFQLKIVSINAGKCPSFAGWNSFQNILENVIAQIIDIYEINGAGSAYSAWKAAALPLCYTR